MQTKVEVEDSRLIKKLGQTPLPGISGSSGKGVDNIVPTIPPLDIRSVSESLTDKDNFVRMDPPQHGTAGKGPFAREPSGVREIARRLKPKWDGDPISWKKFWQHWEYYWKITGPSVEGHPEMAKMLFIECLPKDEAERAMHLVVANNISFDDLVKKYSSSCSSLLPRFALEKRWRDCMPRDRKWPSMDLWFSNWTALAHDVGNLSDQSMKEQFDAVLLKFVPKLIERIHEEELSGTIFTLEERWNFVAHKLRVSQVVGQIRNVFDQVGPSHGPSPVVNSVMGNKNLRNKPKACDICGHTDHLRASCPRRERKYRKFSRSSGSSTRSGTRGRFRPGRSSSAGSSGRRSSDRRSNSRDSSRSSGKGFYRRPGRPTKYPIKKRSDFKIYDVIHRADRKYYRSESGESRNSNSSQRSRGGYASDNFSKRPSSHSTDKRGKPYGRDRPPLLGGNFLHETRGQKAPVGDMSRIRGVLIFACLLLRTSPQVRTGRGMSSGRITTIFVARWIIFPHQAPLLDVQLQENMSLTKMSHIFLRVRKRRLSVEFVEHFFHKSILQKEQIKFCCGRFNPLFRLKVDFVKPHFGEIGVVNLHHPTHYPIRRSWN